MTNGERALVCILGSLAVWTAADAVVAAAADNPYKGIVTRNVFALKAPAPQPPTDLNTPKPSKITLTGIMTILGKKQALMKAPPLPPTKPGEQPKEQSYILAEGQRDGEIEVVQINADAGTVKILNAGTVETLTFDENGVKLASAAQSNPAGAQPFRLPIGEGGATPAALYPKANAYLTPTPAAGSPVNIMSVKSRRAARPQFPQ